MSRLQGRTYSCQSNYLKEPQCIDITQEDKSSHGKVRCCPDADRDQSVKAPSLYQIVQCHLPGRKDDVFPPIQYS
jgi:hypothetical protein